jgi:hypothetical protein
MMDILKDLNHQQQEAVQAVRGPVLILASHNKYAGLRRSVWTY